MARSLTGLWGEFMHQRHGSVRVLDNSAAAVAQVKQGMDCQKCTTRSALRTKRAKFYAEEAAGQEMCGWTSFQASTTRRAF